MSNQDTVTTSPAATSTPRVRTTRGRRLRQEARRAPVGAPTAASATTAPTTAPGILQSTGRFLALAAHPIRAIPGVIGALVTGLLAGGIWAVMTFAIAPSVKHVTAQTPFGAHDVTVSISRWPWGIAFACVLASVLILIAGIRLQRMRDAPR